MDAVKAQRRVRQESAATKVRNLRTFLALAELELKEIGQRITLARKKAGLTQDDLAAMASFSKRSLSDYERGVTEPYRHIREIARLLHRPPEWFLYGESEEDGEVAARLDRIEQVQGETAELLRELVSRLRQVGEESPPS